MNKIFIVPIFQKQAFKFIDTVHRHHRKPAGSVFQLALSNGENIIGVAIVGRPVSRNLQDGFTLEVTRLCTDGAKNACSKLYAACARISKEMGYRKLITYILETETGTTLKAAGWKFEGVRGGGSWDRENRKRTNKHPTIKKLLYVKYFVNE